MTQGLSRRDKSVLRFGADQKAVSYLHAAQFLAPNFEPATDTPCQDDEALLEKKSARGGNRRHAPWPQDRKLRLKAVSRLIMGWERKGLVKTEQPWKDRPKWFWVTMSGIRRLGLSYNDAHFSADEEELDHLYQITRIRLLVGRQPDAPGASWFKHTWVSERVIKANYPQNIAGVTLPHLPDGMLELDEDADVRVANGEKVALKRGECIAIEIERSRKDFARLDAILPDLLRHYQAVWYFCRPKAADAVHATIERLLKAETLTPDQAKLIRVLDLAEKE